MTLGFNPEWLVGFLLAWVRISAWLIIAPPFAGASIPLRVRAGLAAALALVVAPSMPPLPLDAFQAAPMLLLVVYQVLVGLALGFLVLLIMAAVQAAGELIDFFAGFSAAQIYDPLSNATATPTGRLYQLMATMLLFATGGYLLIIRGLLTSFEAAPINGFAFDRFIVVIQENLVAFMVAALEIAAPLLAVLFLTEIVLGLLARAAPQANVLVIGFAVKIMAVLVLVGIALPILPGAVDSLVERVVRSTSFVLGG